LKDLRARAQDLSSRVSGVVVVVVVVVLVLVVVEVVVVVVVVTVVGMKGVVVVLRGRWNELEVMVLLLKVTLICWRRRKWRRTNV